MSSPAAHVFLLSGGAVSWRINDQTTVSPSTAEAEYVALSRAAQESTLAGAINDRSWNDSQTAILEESQSRRIL